MPDGLEYGAFRIGESPIHDKISKHGDSLRGLFEGENGLLHF